MSKSSQKYFFEKKLLAFLYEIFSKVCLHKTHLLYSFWIQNLERQKNSPLYTSLFLPFPWSFSITVMVFNNAENPAIVSSIVCVIVKVNQRNGANTSMIDHFPHTSVARASIRGLILSPAGRLLSGVKTAGIRRRPLQTQ